MDEQEEMLYIEASNFYVINLKPDKDSSFNLCLFTHGFAKILSDLSGHLSIKLLPSIFFTQKSYWKCSFTQILI